MHRGHLSETISSGTGRHWRQALVLLLLLLLLWSRELLVGEVSVLTRVIWQGGDRVLGQWVLLL